MSILGDRIHKWNLEKVLGTDGAGTLEDSITAWSRALEPTEAEKRAAAASPFRGAGSPDLGGPGLPSKAVVIQEVNDLLFVSLRDAGAFPVSHLLHQEFNVGPVAGK